MRLRRFLGTLRSAGPPTARARAERRGPNRGRTAAPRSEERVLVGADLLHEELVDAGVGELPAAPRVALEVGADGGGASPASRARRPARSARRWAAPAPARRAGPRWATAGGRCCAPRLVGAEAHLGAGLDGARAALGAVELDRLGVGRGGGRTRRRSARRARSPWGRSRRRGPAAARRAGRRSRAFSTRVVAARGGCAGRPATARA